MSDTTSCYSSATVSTTAYSEISFSSSSTSKASLSKSRVQAVDPNYGRCLLENTPEQCGVEWVHCFPRRKAGREALMASLEYHWDIPRGSLNLDSRYNIFSVQPHLRQLWDGSRGAAKGSWILLPEEHIVDRYHAQLDFGGGYWKVADQPFPIIENGVFSYRIFCVTAEDMLDVTICREDDPLPTTALPSSNPLSANRITHVHPFNTMPPVKSHLHPKFVILEAGRKLSRSLTPVFTNKLMREHPILRRILNIYVSWTEPCTDSAFIYAIPSSRRGSSCRSDTHSIDSAKYTPLPRYRRIWQRKAAKRNASRRSDGVTRKRRRCSSNPSGRTLREHTRFVGRLKWDSAAFEDWLKDCQPIEDHQPWEDPGYQEIAHLT